MDQEGFDMNCAREARWELNFLRACACYSNWQDSFEMMDVFENVSRTLLRFGRIVELNTNGDD